MYDDESVGFQCSAVEDGRFLDRKQLSEAKRLASFAAKRKLEGQRKAAISESLKNLDTSVTKKIVFKSDSEDDGIAPIKTKKIKLFDDENELDEDPTLDTEPKIYNRHFGKKGAKLASLEAKFGHDKRFQMDEKFIDSDDEEEEVETEDAEKEVHLAILSKVLGKTVAAKKKSKNPVLFRRFDPENEQHVQWLEAQKSKDSKNAKKAKEDSSSGSSSSDEEEQPKARIVDGVFYKLDKEFAETLKKSAVDDEADGAGNTFSFLKSIGRSSSPPQQVTAETERKTSVALSSAKVNEEKLSKDERLKNSKNASEERERLEKRAVALTSVTTPTIFFLNEDDPEVKNVVKNFCRKKSVEAVRNDWGKIRKGIIKVYKGRRKRALKVIKTEIKRFSTFKKDGSAPATNNLTKSEKLNVLVGWGRKKKGVPDKP